MKKLGALVAVVLVAGSTFAAAALAQGVNRANVTMREFSFRMASSQERGRTTFQIRNSGRFPHNFTIVYGPRRFASRTIEGGRTTRVTTTLRPGVYHAICTVRDGGHLAQGMVKTFTVGTQDPETGEWR